MRVERIRTLLAQVRDSVAFVRQHLPEKDAFVSSRLLQNALYKEIEYALQNVLDVCAIVNADLELGLPAQEQTVVDNLRSVLKTVDLINEIKGFRNICVHKYASIDHAVAYDLLSQRLDDFEAVVADIERFLTKV